MIRNLSARQHCPYCGNDGLVVVDWGTPAEFQQEWVATVKEKTEKDGVVNLKARKTLLLALPVHGEQMGPCPKCEKGNAVEFPPEGKPGRWGPSGYWQGRDPIELEPRNDAPADPKLVKEYLARLTEMVKTP